jgi:hypothetical protein
MNFKGNGIDLFLNKSKTAMPIYTMCEIDGARYNFAVSDSDIFRIEGLKDGEHHLRFLRITEPRRSDGESYLFLTAVWIYGEGEILPPPEEKKRRLAFFGDSITAGYGVWGKDEHIPCYTKYQDSTKTYAFMTIEHFDADFQIVAQSGQGVVSDCGGDHGYLVSEYFEHDSPFRRNQYDHSQFNPDVIVLNIGTNDNVARRDHEEFKEQGLKLLSQVREKYPTTPIVWMYGMMGGGIGDAVEKTVEAFGDSKVYFLRTRCVSSAKGEVGSMYHPSVLGQKMGAEALIPLISQITGW